MTTTHATHPFASIGELLDALQGIARIREVRGLRAAQFPEDAGPMAHPVRPGSYVEINNFYTATVYQKGAEVVRMIQTLIGREAFRRGMDEYFRRHDGQAVTCEDFVAAMSAASGFDFGQFMRWYRQPGTPRVEATGHYDAAARRYTLELAQSNPKATDGDPYCIPVRAALLDAAGAEYRRKRPRTRSVREASSTRACLPRLGDEHMRHASRNRFTAIQPHAPTRRRRRKLLC